MSVLQTADSTSAEPCRLGDLPRELRDRIYEFAIEHTADFWLMHSKQIRPPFSLPTMSSSNDTGLNMPNVLAFKLRPFTPLLFVSKDIRQETQEVLRRLQPIWRGIIRSTIHIDRIVSPSPVFRDICSRSRFVLDVDPNAVFDFLKNIPQSMTSCICNVIITRACVARRSGIDAWDPYGGSCPFTDVLQARCRSLHTIALEVPSVISGGQFAILSATRFLLQLLVDNVVNSVHFVQRQIPQDNSRELIIFDMLESVAGLSTSASEPQQHEENATHASASRVFDTLRESGDSLAEWKDLGFEWSLRITRFADTSLDTSTYARHVTRG
ncbi:unnamed protein product [Periconia digitata]|uniref:Uncharacterized protein n=1 Tax=Periconia digitata TaxID=1303443 RepID=A0A9W4XJK4_9PLEO|nr:unnamed protein product [Periconia digitata]